MEDEQHQNMGSTFTGALAYEMELYLAHVGDSRAYRLRQGKLTPLTEDHTMGEKLRKAGQELHQESLPENYNRVLYRSMGARPWIKIDFQILKVLPNDFYLFCSDGLHEFLEGEEIRRALLKVENDPRRAPEALIRLARDRGAQDDISVACILYVDYRGMEMSKGHKTGRLELE